MISELNTSLFFYPKVVFDPTLSSMGVSSSRHCTSRIGCRGHGQEPISPHPPSSTPKYLWQESAFQPLLRLLTMLTALTPSYMVTTACIETIHVVVQIFLLFSNRNPSSFFFFFLADLKYGNNKDRVFLWFAYFKIIKKYAVNKSFIH